MTCELTSGCYIQLTINNKNFQSLSNISNNPPFNNCGVAFRSIGNQTLSQSTI